jgi:hypothetical protein
MKDQQRCELQKLQKSTPDPWQHLTQILLCKPAPNNGEEASRRLCAMTEPANSDHLTNSQTSFCSLKTFSGSEPNSKNGILTSASNFNSNPSQNLYGQDSPEGRPSASVSTNPTGRPKPSKLETQTPIEAEKGLLKESPTPFGKENSLVNWYSSSDPDSPPRSDSSTAETPPRQSHTPVRKLSLTPPLYPSDDIPPRNGSADTLDRSPRDSPRTPAGGGAVPQQGLTASALKKAADPFVPSFKTKDVAPTPVPGRVSKAGNRGKRLEKARAKPKPWQERMAEQVRDIMAH